MLKFTELEKRKKIFRFFSVMDHISLIGKTFSPSSSNFPFFRFKVAKTQDFLTAMLHMAFFLVLLVVVLEGTFFKIVLFFGSLVISSFFTPFSVSISLNFSNIFFSI